MRCSFVLMMGMVLAAALGCRNRATPLSNPFLAPDRVPPPATRTLVPGTAVPYYNDSQQVAPPVSESLSNIVTPQAGTDPVHAGVRSFQGADPTPTRISNHSIHGDRVSVPADNRLVRIDVESQATAESREFVRPRVQSAVAHMSEPAPRVRGSGTEPTDTGRASVRAPDSTSVAASGSDSIPRKSGRWLRPGSKDQTNRAPNQNDLDRPVPRYYEAPPDDWNSPSAQACYVTDESVPLEWLSSSKHVVQ
ncbi:MAG: hypothetical protein JW829_11885 [Pirellulales bacterium]|nr:hypothetical protein [Pirellulales bacterium]